MYGRNWNTGNYRFGFNGKENDNDIKGAGNQQDYGMRIYDNRLGRFLSVDPLTDDYPWYSSYQFAGNKPIIALDLDGLEEYYYTARWNKETGKIIFTLDKVIEQKSFLGIKWKPSYEVNVTFVESDNDETNFNFTTGGTLIRPGIGGGVPEYKNKIEDFDKYKSESDDKEFKSEQEALLDFSGEHGTGAFISEAGVWVNFIGSICKDYQDNGVINGATPNARVNKNATSVNNKSSNPAINNSEASEPVKTIVIPKKYPKAHAHAVEAENNGVVTTGVIDRNGAAKSRRDNIKASGLKPLKNKDRDEYPPAVIKTGSNVSVKHINQHDNRGAGNSVKNQIKGLSNGACVKIEPEK